ncbi:MAG: hypothetical protein JXQ90_22460 [Cyclobacteriaceae bacterium]
MKELKFHQMEELHGGDWDCETYAGLVVGAAAGAMIIGVATGGLGFVVAGGLMGYFGTGGTIYCAMA